MWNPFGPKGPSITFLPMRKTVTVKPGTTVLQAALDNRINLDHSCNGNMACTTCHIYIRSGEASLMPSTPDEDDLLDGAENVQPCSRLGCQTIVHHDLTVEIP
jgi:2Fe-2S ferredoxin